MTAAPDEVMFTGWESEPSSTSPAGTETMRPKHRLDEIDRRQLKHLVDTYKASAFRLIVSLMGDRDRAEDVLVEIFAKASWAEKRKALRGLLGIYELAISECLRRRDQLHGAAETISAPIQGSRARTLQLLSHVSQHARTLLVLRDIMGHSLAELSGFFDTSEEEVREGLTQARLELLKASRSYDKSQASAPL